MAKIKVGVVEDEVIIAQGIIQALHELGYDTTELAISYTEALEMIANEQPDILLLDILLKGYKDGVDLAKTVKEEFNIPFIFLTANSDAATIARAKKVNPPAYLVKPFNKNELYASIEICLHNFLSINPEAQATEKENFSIKDCLFIKQGKSFQKVKINDILYLEANDVYVYVHTHTDKLMVRSSIQHYLDLIGANHFLRIQKGYAVNANHIDSIEPNTVIIKGHALPIGRVYRNELLRFLEFG